MGARAPDTPGNAKPRLHQRSRANCRLLPNRSAGARSQTHAPALKCPIIYPRQPLPGAITARPFRE